MYGNIPPPTVPPVHTNIKFTAETKKAKSGSVTKYHGFTTMDIELLSRILLQRNFVKLKLLT